MGWERFVEVRGPLQSGELISNYDLYRAMISGFMHLSEDRNLRSSEG